MPRAIWRGAISFGMVNIPVKLYTATESKDVAFRQLVAEDMKPLKQLRWSPTLDREVQYDELIKGYEYAKDQYVIVDDEDFEKLPVPSKHTITITAFVAASEIDPVYYEKAYQLDPDEVGTRPFALLMRTMEAKGLVAIGKLALRQKEHLVVLRTVDNRVMLETLFYPDEVRPFEGIDVSDVAVSEQELQMAGALVDMLHQSFDPEQYTDEYRTALMNMISTKLEGGEVVAGEDQQPAAQTVDLMAALRASIEATQARKAQGNAPAASIDADDDEAIEETAEPAAAAPKRAPRKKKAAAS
ncbi:MAG: Ku protein [Chloroflexota bacterium]